DRLTQRGLRAHVDGIDEVLDFENAFLGVPHQPEDNGVDVDGNGVAGERGLSRDARDAHALVHVGAERFDDGNNVAQAGTAQADISAQAQHGDLFPLTHDFDGEQEVEADQCTDNGRSGIVNCPGNREADHEADCEEQAGDATNFVDSNSCHNVY